MSCNRAARRASTGESAVAARQLGGVFDEEAVAADDRPVVGPKVVDCGEPGAEAERGDQVVQTVSGIFEQYVLLEGRARLAMGDELQPPLPREQ